MIIWNLTLLIFMTFCGAIASLFLKKASSNENIMQMLKDVNLYLGAGIYLLSAVLNIIILRYLDYSVVLPLTSITYIWTMLISYLILKENVTKKKIVGVILILVGAIFIAL